MGLFLPAYVALGQDSGAPGPDPGSGSGGSRSGGGIGDPTIINPLKADSFADLLKTLGDLALQIGIPIAVFFIIYSGLKFVLARGNPEEITKAKEMFKWTIVGTFILLGASVLVQAVVGTVQGLGKN